MRKRTPVPDSYWIDFAALPDGSRPEGALLAGEYPGAIDPGLASEKLHRFLDAGVELFVDLTESGEHGLRPYAPIAAAAAGERGTIVAHLRMAIPDAGTPSPGDMDEILDTLDDALAKGQTAYVHCYGGIGRTGTVIGCWLVRHGLTGRQALAKIGAWRRNTPDGWRSSPETEVQKSMVLNWGMLSR